MRPSGRPLAISRPGCSQKTIPDQPAFSSSFAEISNTRLMAISPALMDFSFVHG